MEARGSIFAAAGIVTTVQTSLFAWRKAGIAGLTEGADRVEGEGAFVPGPLFLVLPALAGEAAAGSKP